MYWSTKVSAGSYKSAETAEFKVNPGLVPQKSAVTPKTLKRFPVTSNISEAEHRFKNRQILFQSSPLGERARDKICKTESAEGEKEEHKKYFFALSWEKWSF